MTIKSSGRSSSSWILVLVVLLIPSFFFYNWWTHLNAGKKSGISRWAKNSSPKNLFDTPPASEKLANPMMNPAVQAAPQNPAPTTVSSSTTAPAASDASAEPVETSTTDVVVSRDPMLSPEERRALLNQSGVFSPSSAQQREAAEIAALRRIKSKIHLEGIIYIPGGKSKAIINDEVRSQGQIVEHARIDRIDSKSVVFSYKGRIFKKTFSGGASQ